MSAVFQHVKASLQGAFFICGLALYSQATQADCPVNTANRETARVRFVSDGDTLVLADQRRVRLIGINTPELGHKGNPDQPLAIRARDRLRTLLFTSNNRVSLSPGQEKQDRHGRWLAHLYLPDGRLLAEQLIREGLGWMVAIAPNTLLADCLKKAENDARKSHLGIWAEPAYAPIESANLKLRTRGFHLIQGRIRQLRVRPTAWWLELDGRFSIRIPKTVLADFRPPPDNSWLGRKIAVRGWLYTHRGKLHVNLEHPAALDVLKAE